MSEKDPRFDIVLVYTSFRRHNTYVNIVKHLGTRLRIGIFKLDFDLRKTEKTERRYLAECLKRGATMIDGKAACKLLVMPRTGGGFAGANCARLKDSIRYEKLAIMVLGPFAGEPFLADLYRDFGKGVLLVQDRKNFAAYEPDTKRFLEQVPMEVVEIGSPTGRYPIFPEFKTDYLLAYPSHVSLAQRWQVYPLLRNLLTILHKIPAHDRVTVKLHNATDWGNWISERGHIAKLALPLSFLYRLLRFLDVILCLSWGGRELHQRLPERLLYKVRSLQNQYIFTRCKNLLDDYPAFGIEHFIHGVQKGVIAGLSTTLWEALLQRKPVQLYDDLPLEGRSPNFKILAARLGVESWRGLSEKGFEAIDDQTRSADLMNFLERSVASAPDAQAIA